MRRVRTLRVCSDVGKSERSRVDVYFSCLVSDGVKCTLCVEVDGGFASLDD